MPDSISSGQTTVVGSGELRSFDDVANAGTIKNAGTTIDAEPINTVIASGVGRGVGSGTTNRFNTSFASGAGLGIGAATAFRVNPDPSASGTGRGVGSSSAITADYIRSGETFSIPSTRQTGFDDVQNAGTITNAGTSVDIQQPASVSASGAGLGIGAAIKPEFFEFSAATGIGRGFGTARNPRPFDPVQQVIRLIENTDDSRWRTDKPDRVAAIWEYSHNDRINFPGSAFYVYTPSDATVDKFGIEGDSLNQTITIEILIMTLSEFETQGYINNTVQFISQLYNDNTENSGLFHRFGSISAADLRNEHITQQTDHYIATVSFEIQRFRDIDSLQSAGDFQ
jgi:hypothetical protein